MDNQNADNQKPNKTKTGYHKLQKQDKYILLRWIGLKRDRAAARAGITQQQAESIQATKYYKNTIKEPEQIVDTFWIEGFAENLLNGDRWAMQFWQEYRGVINIFDKKEHDDSSP